MGAELTFFSPLSGAASFEADALYLPGGYPELHLEALSFDAIRAHIAAGKPALAECGGMLALLDRLNDVPMAGVISGEARMQSRLVNLGLHFWGSLRGHTFHHSSAEIRLDPVATSTPTRPQGRGEAVYRVNKLTATYLHLYFGSDPELVAKLFT